MKTALLVIATGERYRKYAADLLASARTYFVPHTAVVFADGPIGSELPFMNIEREPWPGPTLHRYHTFLKAEKYLQCFDQLFYIDADMLFVAPVGEEIFSPFGLTATLHPGYIGGCGTPERRPQSISYISTKAENQYFCGGFNGGNADHFLDMAYNIKEMIDEDAKQGIVPTWHDESAINKYWNMFPPSKILDPSYCYPENAGDHYLNKWKAAGINPTPKILALTKDGR
jgi:hypothetical protein